MTKQRLSGVIAATLFGVILLVNGGGCGKSDSGATQKTVSVRVKAVKM